MKTPIIISVIFHCGVLTFASMDIPWFDSSDVRPMEIIPIEMVDISEVTKLQEIAKLPEPDQEKPEPPKRPERRAEMPPPPPRMQSSMPLPDSANQPAAKPKAPVKR
ncbi:MAG: cell envelope integrity protein TolA, partial [Kordiimonadaceae bacterium]|nr:cell envelope integrity protein TolA [Kordiimonadaceae bacterium]